MKNQKGITLIALIITIIVMLILVGVSVSVALNGGLFRTAQQAVDQTQLHVEKEKLLSITLGALGNDGKIDLDKLDDAIKKDGTFKGTNGTYESETGELYTVIENGSITQSVAYSIGDEVIVNGESFYVIEESDISDSAVTLLAKYNLNKAGTAQSTAKASEIACAFSNINYWYNSETDTYETDLNALEVPEKVGTETVTSVIKTARNYGNAKGGEGRLLTYEEADALKIEHPEIIFQLDGTNGRSSYWLASLINKTTVRFATTDGNTFMNDIYSGRRTELWRTPCYYNFKI